MIRRPPRSTLFPLHDALPISLGRVPRDRIVVRASPHPGLSQAAIAMAAGCRFAPARVGARRQDRKSTRLNSSHTVISYAVFCLKKKKKKRKKDKLRQHNAGRK